jgi:hypothetical protein
MPVTPHSAAGWRMEPPVSVAVAMGATRAATAAAEPPELPPGTRRSSHGFFTGPYQLVSLEEPMANSSMLVLPSVTMPAALSLSTTVASYGDTKLSSMREPQLVLTPRVQKMSLCAKGKPVSGPALPAASAASATAAWASADSAVTVMKALSFGCAAVTRRSRLFVSSVTENSLARSFFASSASVNVCIVLVFSYSMTLGTRYSAASTWGALRWYSSCWSFSVTTSGRIRCARPGSG